MTRPRRNLVASALALTALLALSVPSAQAARPGRPPSLQAQLRQVQDVLAIQQLLGDYTVDIDAKDWPAYSALFADEGELIFSGVRAKGPEAIRQVMGKTAPVDASGRALPELRHLCTNIVIRVDGDHGLAHSRWTALAADADGKIRVGGAGRYEDQLTRQRGQWKFLRRVVYGDFPARDPLVQK